MPVVTSKDQVLDVILMQVKKNVCRKNNNVCGQASVGPVSTKSVYAASLSPLVSDSSPVVSVFQAWAEAGKAARACRR